MSTGTVILLIVIAIILVVGGLAFGLYQFARSKKVQKVVAKVDTAVKDAENIVAPPAATPPPTPKK